MSAYLDLLESLKSKPQTWLVTGVAGFIGSNLLSVLLKANQRVIGLDNFSTGNKQNVTDALNATTGSQRSGFTFLEGDIRNSGMCRKVVAHVDYIIHLAAIGSVPRSIEDPYFSNDNNVSGFLQLLLAAKNSGVRRFVYASSSAVYGETAELPKVEHKTGQPLSPYAITKVVNELYAEVFTRIYKLETIGLRYFNVFGPRQNPEGPYAAVIPRWINAMIQNKPVDIYGDGTASRDFCYVANAIQANLLAACTTRTDAIGQIFNVAVNDRTSLLDLFEIIRCRLVSEFPHLRDREPQFHDARNGDIRHSQADVTKARKLLGYVPTHTVEEGLAETLTWYKRNHIPDEEALRVA